jgi:hypothetical protein
MKVDQIALALAPSKAATKTPFGSIKMLRPLKLKAAYKSLPLYKESAFRFILADYARMKAVATAVAKGERPEPKLPKHVKESFRVKDVKFWRGFSGAEYLPLPAPNGQRFSRIVALIDGEAVEVPKAEVEKLCLASEFAKKATRADMQAEGQEKVFGPNVENIKALNKGMELEPVPTIEAGLVESMAQAAMEAYKAAKAAKKA